MGAANEHHAKTLTTENFEQQALQSDQPVLVDFWAEWCGPCQAVAPVIEDLAQQYEGQAVVGKVDVDQNAQLAAEYGVRSIPTLIVFKNGEPVEKIVGLVPKAEITEKLDMALGQNATA